MAASSAARRLLLLGDPQQLPQVSQATHVDAVDESALGWLMQGYDTLPAKFGYFLADSYRMHPELCSKVSALSYERRLEAAAEAGKRDLEGVAAGIGVVQVEHTGNRTESIEEARVVVEQIQSLVGKRWRDSQDVPARPLEANDFLVVAPYNAQVARIREELDVAGLSAVRVGTVDKFQGQEAPIAIVSMTASSHGDVPRGMAFLLNRNRVNVAVSRAKWRAIIVRSAALTNYMPNSLAELLELGAFIGLCEESP
jgi:superfamily I DNA and/or RNA helicase